MFSKILKKFDQLLNKILFSDENETNDLEKAFDKLEIKNVNENKYESFIYELKNLKCKKELLKLKIKNLLSKIMMNNKIEI